MANLNTDYEKLAKEIYEEILQNEDIKTIKVQHNVRIEGNSKQKHQIDVYWEFYLADVFHRVAVECKNYGKRVQIGAIRDFSAVLTDIGNIQGIFVTKVGYQSGAVEFAKHKRIALKILKEPNEKELQDIFPPHSSLIRTHIYYLDNVRPDIKFDYDWAFENKILKEGERFSIFAQSENIKVVEPNGNVFKTYQELCDALPRDYKEEYDKIHTYSFENKYLSWPNSPYSPIKLKCIKFIYNVKYAGTKLDIKVRMAAKALLKDIESGKIDLHRKVLTIEKRQSDIH